MPLLTPQNRALLLDVGFFDWLTQPELTSLLATCKTLRCDGAIATDALRRHRFARDFRSHHDYSTHSWTAVPPYFDVGSADRFSDVVGQELRSPNWFTFSNEQFEHESDSLWADDSSFATASADQRTKLLSLVGLMEKELDPFCGLLSVASLNHFYAQPFLVPLDLPRDAYTDDMVYEQLEAINERLGDMFFDDTALKTAIGMHWENMAVGREARVQCVFCETMRHEIDVYLEANEEYWDTRDDRWDKEYTSLVDAGVDPDEATERVEQQFEEQDQHYNQDLLDDSEYQDQNAVGFMEKMPRLKLIEHGDEDEEVYDEVAVAVSGMSLSWSLCNALLKPLHHFFERNGFRGVRRVRLPRWAFDHDESNLRRVEGIGGISPGGFFAGVYLVEVYTY